MKFTYTILVFLLSFTICNAQSTRTTLDKNGNTVLKDSDGKVMLIGVKDVEGNIVWKDSNGISLEQEVLKADALSITSLDKAIIRANRKED